MDLARRIVLQSEKRRDPTHAADVTIEGEGLEIVNRWRGGSSIDDCVMDLFRIADRVLRNEQANGRAKTSRLDR